MVVAILELKGAYNTSRHQRRVVVCEETSECNVEIHRRTRQHL